MFKKVFGRKLSRGGGSRKALFRSLIRAIVAGGKIVTTKAKAKAVQGEIDKVMVLLKKEDQAARKRLLAILGNDKNTLESLIEKYFVSTKDRKSGFTRITALPNRKGDQAKMAILEFVDKAVEIKREPKAKKAKEIKKTAKPIAKKVVKTVKKAAKSRKAAKK